MSPVLIAAVGAIGLALVVLAAWAVVSRRAIARRLDAAATRLGGLDDDSGRRTDALLSRLERVIDAAAARDVESRAAADRLSRAFETIDLGIVVCDEDGQVVFRNGRAQAFDGARHGDALAEQAIDDVLQSAVHGSPLARAVDLFGPPRRNLSIAGAPLTDGRRFIGAVAIVEDVSERRRLEAVRRDFVANVSHELKTPVGALGLLAETLSEESDPGVARRFAERMQLEATRVARIIDDLLDLSRLEAEQAPVREPVAVHLVVAQAVEQVVAAAEHRDISIKIGNIPKRLTVVGDRRQLVSAVFNLLENAVKYSSDGDEVEVTCRAAGNATELAIRDHGIGIPSRDHERIFERFYRVDRGRGRDTGGTGLGLAIVRHVLTNHGGDVSVSSREGEGAVFTLRLPVAPGLVAVPDAG
jgi:two-component system sensor histidine kinase SenX3